METLLFLGGKSEALPHTLPRWAEEHGEDGSVCGSQTEGGWVEWRVGERRETRGEEPHWSAGRRS